MSQIVMRYDPANPTSPQQSLSLSAAEWQDLLANPDRLFALVSTFAGITGAVGVSGSGGMALDMPSQSMQTGLQRAMAPAVMTTQYYGDKINAKTWFNRAGTIEYCRFPKFGFKKSNFPDKFGRKCYYRKVNMVVLPPAIPMDSGSSSAIYKSPAQLALEAAQAGTLVPVPDNVVYPIPESVFNREPAPAPTVSNPISDTDYAILEGWWNGIGITATEWYHKRQEGYSPAEILIWIKDRSYDKYATVQQPVVVPEVVNYYDPLSVMDYSTPVYSAPAVSAPAPVRVSSTSYATTSGYGIGSTAAEAAQIALLTPNSWIYQPQ